VLKLCRLGLLPDANTFEAQTPSSAAPSGAPLPAGEATATPGKAPGVPPVPLSATPATSASSAPPPGQASPGANAAEVDTADALGVSGAAAVQLAAAATASAVRCASGGMGVEECVCCGAEAALTDSPADALIARQALRRAVALLAMHEGFTGPSCEATSRGEGTAGREDHSSIEASIIGDHSTVVYLTKGSNRARVHDGVRVAPLRRLSDPLGLAKGGDTPMHRRAGGLSVIL